MGEPQEREDRAAVLAALLPREETIELGGRALTVRELAHAADVLAMADNEDLSLKLLVRSVYAEDGALLFTDADIPALKRAGMMRLKPLVDMVQRVNGWSAEDNEKK